MSQNRVKNASLIVGVFLVSAGILALEVALMRCLCIASYHHFSYLVISTALLGFGASGTFLSLYGRVFVRHFWQSASGAASLFAITVIACFGMAQSLPLDVQYVLYSWRQMAVLFVYHLLIFIPFFFGALIVGLSLMRFVSLVHSVYAANLVGSGVGAAGIILLMFFIPPQLLLYVVAFMGVMAAGLFALGGYLEKGISVTIPRRYRFWMCTFSVPIAAVLIISFLAIFAPLHLRIDPYKALALMRNLERQGDARHIASRYSPRARLDVYDSARLHTTLFASLAATLPAPPQMLLLADGASLSPIFKIASPGQAQILTFTPTEIAYRLAYPKSVLLLGETGGVNVWLARLHRAEKVTVVQPNEQVFDLMKRPLDKKAGGVFSASDVVLVRAEPRAYLEHNRERFDLIQIVSLESPAAGVSGLQSLDENYLLTVEGIRAAIAHLNRRGILTVTRGLQSPPRDNVKILATFIEASEASGFKNPARHIIQVRNYLAGCTLASPAPFDKTRLSRLRSACEALAMDIVWVPDVRTEELNRYDVRSGPAGKTYSYYHYAALELFSKRHKEFYKRWAYNIRPATDDCPYFYDFFKWRSLPAIMKSYGRHWLQRLELGYVVLIAALAESAVVAMLLILLPLLRLSKGCPKRRGRTATFIYFALLGLAYIMIEMVFIQKFVLFLGDRIYAVGVVLAAFLIFSGLGSLTGKGGTASPKRHIRLAIAGIILVGIMYLISLDAIFGCIAGLPLWTRLILSLMLLGPIAFLMGRPFPSGISLIGGRAPTLVPLAWGINGFCSVIAASGGVALSMSIGFSGVMILSLASYIIAGAMAGELGD